MGDTVDGIEWARSHWPEEDWPDWPDASDEPAASPAWSRRRLRIIALIVVTAMVLAAVLPAVISALRRPPPEPSPPAVTTLVDSLPRNVFNGVT